MNRNDFPSSPSDPSDEQAPRRSMLRHHEPSAGSDQKNARDEEALENAELPSATSLKNALARANLKEGGPIDNAPDLQEPADADPAARSSLPLALARANESRKLPAKPFEGDEQESENADAIPPLSITDFFFRFDRFADGVHPLRGWGVFSLFYVLSALLLGQSLTQCCQSSHPGPLTLTGTSGFWIGYLGKSLGLGVGISVLIILMAWLLYGFGRGRPPFLWVFKLVVYAAAPVLLARAYLLLGLSDVGMEAFLRGYRPERWMLTGQVVYTVSGIWFMVRFLQSASSRHCQAKWIRMALPTGILFLTGLGVLWGQASIARWLGRGALEDALVEAEQLFLALDPEADARIEALGSRDSYFWSHDQKVRLYLLRGETRLLSGDLPGGREDMIRLVRMRPRGDPIAALGRGINSLVLGRVEETVRLLEAVNRITDGAIPSCGRWLTRIHRGDYGEAVKDSDLAGKTARDLQYAYPSARHLEMAIEALFANDQDRRILRELAEAERMEVDFSATTALFGAIAAERSGSADLAERWWSLALSKDPDVGMDERAAALRERLTSRP